MPGKVAMRGGALISAGLMIAGCGWFGPVRADAQDVAAVAPSECVFALNDAAAWINKMPGPARSDARPVIVSAQLTDVRAKAVLERSDRSAGKTLVLEIVESDAAPIPGRLAWRGAAPEEMYERVEIVCGGEVLRVIDGVERVF